MNLILVVALLTGAPEPTVARVGPQQAFSIIADDVETGTLIVSQGDCLAIKIYSASAYTHVAAVVVHEREMLVYDATGGAGVRKQSLSDYLLSQNDHTLHVLHPRRSFSPKRAIQFERHLENQLGRPYAIHHHLSGERAAGLHCSEYVTDALICAEVLCARQPPRVSPATLVEGILKADLYDEATTIALVPDSPQRPASQSWCSQIWFDTKQCSCACYVKLRGWFCCK